VPATSALGLSDSDATGGSRRRAIWRSGCSAPGTVPGSFVYSDRFSVDLPVDAWSVSGTTIIFRLRRDDLPFPASEPIEPGVRWLDIQALARDGARLNGIGSSEADSDAAVHGPGAMDEAATAGRLASTDVGCLPSRWSTSARS
jgi:hypothetical protein